MPDGMSPSVFAVLEVRRAPALSRLQRQFCQWLSQELGQHFYHQGMVVEVDPDRTVVRGSDGAPLSAQDLTADDVVWIWTAECAESSPVQCTIDAIVVDRPA